MIRRDTPLREVAFEVCTALDRIGVRAVLTGGSAATVYAPRAYQSRDLDFILQLYAPPAKPGEALKDLGYTLRGAHRRKIKLKTIRDWCLREGEAERYEEFARRLGKK